MLGDPPIGAVAFFNNVQSGGVMNASAVVEPDADGDGFGDETQDGCLGNAAVQGACPVASGSTPTAKKKCKKRKHRRAVSAKKKCKKKQKKRK